MYSSVPSPPYPQPTAVAASSPPGRPGRLRGLSYLRTYTQNHILSRDNQRPSVGRATSYPTPTSTTSRNSPAPASTSPSSPRQPSPSSPTSTANIPAERSSYPEHINSTTSGWLPTVGGQSGVSRTGARPQSTATESSSAVLSSTRSSVETTESTEPMGRTRSASAAVVADMPQAERTQNEASVTGTTNGNSGTNITNQLPSIRFIAHQDPRAQRPSLVFSPMARTLPSEQEIIKVGRYSERDNQPSNIAYTPSAAPVGFKSKVVSRRHCEFWCTGGRWFIKDVKSSSGTFLNHIRLSSPGTESRPFPIKDGDIVQLGIDFKGGEEMIFRCVKIRVELNKGWQQTPNSFNVQSHKRLRELRELNNQGKSSVGGSPQDCSICLNAIAPCQSLFVAPCSHTWHYKCIRVIINGPHWPHFICPNCRTVADLEAEIDDPSADGEWEQLEAEEAEAPAAPAAPAQASSNDQSRSRRHIDSSEQTYVTAQASTQETGTENSDGEVVEASDESDEGQHISDTAEAMGYLNINETDNPSASSASSETPEASSATVRPVDIVRKPVAALGGSTSQFEQTPRQNHDRPVRTPSPGGLPSSLSEAIINGEGPMTPRNDAGPFVFDGSAGRLADPGSTSTSNTDPQPNTTPAPDPQHQQA